MKTLRFKILPQGLIKFYNVIHIVGNDYDYFNASLPYLRNFDRSRYISGRVKPDELDLGILQSIQETYPKSFMRSELLMYEGQLEERLKAIEGGVRLPYEIALIPVLPDIDTYLKENKEYVGYTCDLSLRVLLGPQNEKLKNIMTFASCFLDTTQIEQLKETITGIQ